MFHKTKQSPYSQSKQRLRKKIWTLEVLIGIFVDIYQNALITILKLLGTAEFLLSNTICRFIQTQSFRRLRTWAQELLVRSKLFRKSTISISHTSNLSKVQLCKKNLALFAIGSYRNQSKTARQPPYGFLFVKKSYNS